MKVNIQEGFPDMEILIKCVEITDEIRKMESLLLHGFESRLPGVKDGVTHLINKQDIFYFESVDKRSFLYTANDVYEVSLKLYEIENILTDIGFFRNSKSQIINIAKIESLRPDFGGRMDVMMKNGEQAIVSRQYAKILKERLGLK